MATRAQSEQDMRQALRDRGMSAGQISAWLTQNWETSWPLIQSGQMTPERLLEGVGGDTTSTVTGTPGFGAAPAPGGFSSGRESDGFGPGEYAAGTIDEVRAAAEDAEFQAQTIEGFLEIDRSAIENMLNAGMSPTEIVRRRDTSLRRIENDLVRASDGAIVSDVLTAEDQRALNIADVEAQRLQDDWGVLATYNGYDSVDDLVQAAQWAFLEHGSINGGSQMANIAAAHAAGDLSDSALLGALSNPELLSQINQGGALYASIFPRAITHQVVRYKNDFGSVQEVSVNPALYAQVLQGLGGDDVFASVVIGAAHRALGSTGDGYDAQFEKYLPVVAGLVAMSGVSVKTNRRIGLDNLVFGDSATAGERDERFRDHPAGPDRFAGAVESGRASNTNLMEPLISGLTDAGFLDTAAPQGANDGLATNAAFEANRNPFTPTAPLNVQLPISWVQDQAATWEAGRLMKAMEIFGDQRELAVLFLYEPDLARSIYANGSPQTEAEAARARQVFDAMPSGSIESMGLFSDSGVTGTGSRTATNMFNVGGEYGVQARATGQTITASLPDPDSTRLAYKELYRQLLLAEPSDAELNAFVGQMESDSMTNASRAAAEISSSGAGGAGGNFFMDQGPTQDVDDVAARIIKQYQVDVQGSAYAALEASSAFAKLYRQLPAGMSPLEYASKYAQEVGQYLQGGEGASESFLSAQRRGMMIGGPAGSDVAASNAVLSEEGLASEGVQERWARSARQVAEYF